MQDIRSQMPVLARHEGNWEGLYIHVDPDNRELDRHVARLQCMFPESGPYAYHQINTYIWADGRTEEIHFPATFKDKAIWLDTDRIHGRAWELDHRSVVLTWSRKDLPGSYLYEMIQISDDNQNRGRTWHCSWTTSWSGAHASRSRGSDHDGPVRESRHRHVRFDHAAKISSPRANHAPG